MTNRELYNILDDKNKKLTKDELLNILYELEHDTSDEVYYNKELVPLHKQYYMGESDAFHIALLLVEHLETYKNKGLQLLECLKENRCLELKISNTNNYYLVINTDPFVKITKDDYILFKEWLQDDN